VVDGELSVDSDVVDDARGSSVAARSTLGARWAVDAGHDWACRTPKALLPVT
jgi:hypothetical protein